MTPDIQFMDAFPHALRPEVESLLTPFLEVASDLRTICVHMKGAGDDPGEAAILVKRRYHIAHLYLDSSFFDLTFAEKELFLIHELVHVVVDIFSREVRHVLAEFIPEDLREFVGGRLEDAEETVVDRIAHLYHEALSASNFYDAGYEDGKAVNVLGEIYISNDSGFNNDPDVALETYIIDEDPGDAS
jgi:hypothetical protein